MGLDRGTVFEGLRRRSFGLVEQTAR